MDNSHLLNIFALDNSQSAVFFKYINGINSMKRDIYITLCRWKDEPTRRPLLIRGARQTGKTFIVNEFGQKEFTSLIAINFERNPEYKDIFSSFSPVEIIEKISLYTGKRTESRSSGNGSPTMSAEVRRQSLSIFISYPFHNIIH